jgi:hypothetical protein
VQLTTDRTRTDARRFYERLGFVASHEGMKLALPGGSQVDTVTGVPNDRGQTAPAAAVFRRSSGAVPCRLDAR